MMINLLEQELLLDFHLFWLLIDNIDILIILDVVFNIYLNGTLIIVPRMTPFLTLVIFG
jgi:hypothetical protein